MHAAEHAHESSFAMTVPLMVLAVLAVVALILGLPGHTPVSELFQHYLSPVFAPGTERLHEVGHFHAGDQPAGRRLCQSFRQSVGPARAARPCR